MKLTKLKKKGKNYAVFYFTGKRFFFNIYDVIVKQKIKKTLCISLLTDSETQIPPTTNGDDSNYRRRERDAADHLIVGVTNNITFLPETLDIAAGCHTHQNLGMSPGDTRDNDHTRHSDIMMQVHSFSTASGD
jgi:hypothetical protein